MEKELITEAKNMNNILPFLFDAAKQLEKGGADFIVIPCNTVHIFIEEIRESVNIPVLSIIEEASNFLRKEKIKEIGVLATSATIKNKLFDENLKQRGIEMKIPNNLNQTEMGVIINRLVNNQHTEEDKNKLLEIIKGVNAKNVVLACTDLQILEPKIQGIKIFDTMDILAKSCCEKNLKMRI